MLLEWQCFFMWKHDEWMLYPGSFFVACLSHKTLIVNLKWNILNFFSNHEFRCVILWIHTSYISHKWYLLSDTFVKYEFWAEHLDICWKLQIVKNKMLSSKMRSNKWVEMTRSSIKLCSYNLLQLITFQDISWSR